MIAKKKQILTATLVIALICAVGVNWYYSKPDSNPVSQSTTQAQEKNLGDSLLVAGSVMTTGSSADGSKATTSGDTSETGETFAKAKLSKTQSHDEIKSQIEKLMNSDNLDTESKNQLTKLMTDFTDSVKKENDCESLISAKTASDCIVIINGETAQVIMQKNSLDEASILQITEIIEKNANISAENLTIIEAK